jgi:CBS domain containing-hemolysin-like protein
LALLAATMFVIRLFQNFGFFVGWISALVLLILAWILSRLLEDFAKNLISLNLDFWLKYFAWTSVFSRISRLDGEVKIGSEHELLHVISESDFLDETSRKMYANMKNFREKTIGELMIPAEKVRFVHAKDELTPLFIDELFASGHKLFPVVNSQKNEFEHIVGLLDLDDFREISAADFEQKMDVADAMRPIAEPISAGKDLLEMLDFFAKNNTTFALISRDEKIVGIATLADVLREVSGE